jgi:hypothetical protein
MILPTLLYVIAACFASNLLARALRQWLRLYDDLQKH